MTDHGGQRLYLVDSIFDIPQCCLTALQFFDPFLAVQAVEQPNHNQQILVTDFNSHPVFLSPSQYGTGGSRILSGQPKILMEVAGNLR